LLRARERGTLIATINAHEHVPGRFADLWLKPIPGGEEKMLAELAAGKTKDEDTGTVIRLLKEAKNPVLVVGPGILACLAGTVEQLQASANASVVVLAAEGNLAGGLRAGFGGTRPVPPPLVLYLIGVALPYDLDTNAFVLMQTTHIPDADQISRIRSGLLLPMATFSETNASFLTQSGAVRHLRMAATPPGDALPGWQILCNIAQAMGKPGFDFNTAAEISAQFSRYAVAPIITNSAPDWLIPPDEHDFLGTPLAKYVDGLRQLDLDGHKEQRHVSLD